MAEKSEYVKSIFNSSISGYEYNYGENFQHISDSKSIKFKYSNVIWRKKMLFVNIIHDAESILEYIFISLFFKLFGIATYNSVFHRELPDPLEVPDDFTQHCIFISKNTVLDSRYEQYAGVTSISDETIIFPKRKNRNDIIKFFNNLLDDMSSKIEDCEEFEDFYAERERLIDVFISVNPLVTWYIPLRVIKARYFSRMAVSRLFSNFEDTKDSKSEYEQYAHINIGYMANHLCDRDIYKSHISWDDLIDECEELTIPFSLNQKSVYLMMGRLYDESGKNNALSDISYKESDYKYNYYASYRRARLHEFKYNDKDACRKYLIESREYNPNYYRTIFKLGLLADSNDEYVEALENYIDVLDILEYNIQEGSWTPLEMEYYIKSCGKIMGLNRYFRANKTMKSFVSRAKKCRDSAENNKFFENLAEFIYDKVNSKETWYGEILRNVKNNADDHYERFCSMYSFD